MYSFDSVIRYSEVDLRAKVNVFELVNYFQDCSTFQSEELGGGVDALHHKNVTWVLANWNIQVLRYPNLGEKVTVGTFPYSFRDCFGMRNYIMTDKDGNTLAMADSLWTLIDYEKGNIVKIDDDIRKIYQTEEKLPMNYLRGRIKVPEELKKMDSVKIAYHCLDSNMHVNNAHYLRIALDNIEIKDYEQIRVEYRKQVRKDDILTPYVGKNEVGTVVMLKNEDGENCNVMEFR